MGHWLERIGKAGPIGHPKWIGIAVAVLRNVGFPEKILPYLLAQMAHESAWGTSRIALVGNNWSGIEKNGAGLQNGTIKSSDWGKEIYGSYATPTKWASDYKRILSLSPGRPIDATSAQDFLLRLLKNNYFGSRDIKSKKSAVYIKGFNAAIKEVNKYLDNPVDTGLQKSLSDGVTDLNKDKDQPDGVFAFARKHPLLTGGAVATGLILIIRSVGRR